DVGKGVRLLDIGSGAGTALRIAAARGATDAGIDAADGLVAVAREQVPDADIRLGDLASLPFADGSFDVVTSFNAVQYAADPVAEAACWHALSGALAASRRDDGSYQQANVFRYLVARV